MNLSGDGPASLVVSQVLDGCKPVWVTLLPVPLWTCNLLLTILANPFFSVFQSTTYCSCTLAHDFSTHPTHFLHKSFSCPHIFLLCFSAFCRHYANQVFAMLFSSVDLVYHLHTHDVCLSCMRWLDLLFTFTQIRDCQNRGWREMVKT